MVDSFHNTIVCAGDYSPGPVGSFLTTKYDPNGQLLWQRRYDTFANDDITSAVTDASGAVYVGGNTYNSITGNLPQFIVIKYAANGDVLWEYRFDGPSIGSNYLTSLRLDSAQNLMVFGVYVDVDVSEVGFMVARIDSQGNPLWESTYISPDFPSVGGLDVRWTGDHWFFWGYIPTANGARYFGWQIAPEDGQTLDISLSEFYPDNFTTQHIDSAGNLYVGGGDAYEVVKFSSTGALQWTYKKPTTIFPFPVVAARLTCIQTNTANEVFVTGFIRIDTFGPVVTLMSKLSSSGGLLWEHELVIDGIPGCGPTKSYWINDDLLAVVGAVSLNLDSNYYEFFLALYDNNGLVRSGITNLEGPRNRATSIIRDGDYLYVAGYADPDYFLDKSKQVLCKYALSALVNTISPPHRKIAQLTIFPNPFTRQSKISVDYTGSDKRGVLQLYDVSGRSVYRRTVALIQGLQTLELEAPVRLPAGIYTVVLSTSDRYYTVQAVKTE